MASSPYGGRDYDTYSNRAAYEHHRNFEYEKYEPEDSGPSCLKQAAYGSLMGATVGASFGVLFGGYTAFSSGIRGREMFSFIGKACAGSASTFGVFMAVGAFVRCEGERLANDAAWAAHDPSLPLDLPSPTTL